MIDSGPEGNSATAAGGDAVENFIQSGLICVGDQTASEVFLQGLMGARRSLPQDSVSVFGNVFDLHARHGAILAPVAPQCKSTAAVGIKVRQL